MNHNINDIHMDAMSDAIIEKSHKYLLYESPLEFFYYYFKNVGNARLGESNLHYISPKTPAPQYKHEERRERKNSRRRNGSEQLTSMKKN